MPSPAKKRRLNADSKEASLPSRGLEYFFSRQRQNGPPSRQSEATAVTSGAVEPSPQGLTDEELARKLQAEWNQEPESGNHASVAGSPAADPEPGANKTESTENTVTPEPDSLGPSAQVSAPRTAGKGTLSLQSVAAAEDHVSASIPLDESPLTFEPAKYISQLQSHWATEGGDASYALLTRCFVLVSATQSRIKIVDTLVNCLRVLIEADASSLLPAVRNLKAVSSEPWQ